MLGYVGEKWLIGQWTLCPLALQCVAPESLWQGLINIHMFYSGAYKYFCHLFNGFSSLMLLYTTALSFERVNGRGSNDVDVTPPTARYLLPLVSSFIWTSSQEFNISINCKHLHSFVPSRRLYQQLVHYPQVTPPASLVARPPRLAAGGCAVCTAAKMLKNAIILFLKRAILLLLYRL